MRLKDKVVILTGGAGAQGTVEAELLAREGAAVVVADIQEDAGKALAERLTGQGLDVCSIKLDVASQESWDTLVEEVKERYGRLHVLINNAAINAPGMIPDIDIGQWERIMRVNVTGSLMGIQACARLMKESGGGSIVNIGSTAGLHGHWLGAYSASKWALRALTRTAAYDLAPWKIRVNTVCPGLVEETGSNRIMPEDVLSQFRKASALKRGCRPVEVAYAVLFLASDESSFITGIDLPVDGGFTGTGVYGQIEEEGKFLAGYYDK